MAKKTNVGINSFTDPFHQRKLLRVSPLAIQYPTVDIFTRVHLWIHSENDAINIISTYAKYRFCHASRGVRRSSSIWNRLGLSIRKITV